MTLNRKARARLYRNKQRREYRRTFSAAVKHAQAQLAMERTWCAVDQIIRELAAAIKPRDQESSQ